MMDDNLRRVLQSLWVDAYTPLHVRPVFLVDNNENNECFFLNFCRRD